MTSRRRSCRFASWTRLLPLYIMKKETRGRSERRGTRAVYDRSDLETLPGRPSSPWPAPPSSCSSGWMNGTWKRLHSVEWVSIFFFVGLFVLVGSLQHVGVRRQHSLRGDDDAADSGFGARDGGPVPVVALLSHRRFVSGLANRLERKEGHRDQNVLLQPFRTADGTRR